MVERCANPPGGNKTLWEHCRHQLFSIFIAATYCNMKITGLFFLMLSFSCSPRQEERNPPVIASGNDLPKMTVTTSDRSSVNLYDLKGKTILILFQPDCDYCQREAKEIRQHLDRFREYTLYFISSDQLPAIDTFGRSYDLLGQANVNFASTTVESVINNFGPIPAPSVYIYADQKLVNKFNGEVDIKRILEAI